MSSRRGPPKHQNNYAWKPNAGIKINETELGGKFRPLSEITGVCPRCKEQIDWKRRYGKYKPLKEPAKCQLCSKRNVRQAYHNLCSGCAKEQKVCAKCRCSVSQIVGRDSADVEEEQKMLGEAIKNARERDRRTLLRAMNPKSKPKGSSKATANKENGRVGEIFPSTSLEEYAKLGRKDGGNHDDCCDSGDDDDVENDEDDDENENDEDDDENENDGDDNENGDDVENDEDDDDGNEDTENGEEDKEEPSVQLRCT